MTYTTDDVIKSVKRGITVPNFQALMTDDDILNIMDEETSLLLLPIVLSLRSEYLVTRQFIPIVNSQADYDIPYRSVGRGSRNLLYVVDAVFDSNGVYVSGSGKRLSYVQPEDMHLYENNGTSGFPRGFCYRGDKIRITPPSSDTSAFLDYQYHIRPNKYCLTSAAGKVTNFNLSTKTVTLDKIPTSVTAINDQCDILQGKQGCTLLDFDVTVTAVSGTTLTLNRIPATLAKGDWVAATEKSPILQLPEECMLLLAQASQCKILEALGDTEGFQTAKSRLDDRERQLRDLLTPRAEGAQMKITNTNGLIRSSRRRYF